MRKPVVAVVGRPNVGKSTFFNYIAGKRISIVEDTPGVTRDRIYTDVDWRGTEFTLVDTGGIEPKTDDAILKHMKIQAEMAIDLADVIIFLVDMKDGITANDEDVAIMLRKSRKPIVVAVNKVDRVGDPPPEIYDFYNLAMGEIFPVSSLHGLGMGELLDECYQYFPQYTNEEEDEEEIKVAIIGKPNAGKSSLLNALAGEKRVIVSDIAGTTRDAIDTPIEKYGQKFVFIDTAGIRRKNKIDDDIEKYSVMRAWGAIERSDVCVLIVDATEGVTEQDSKIAGYAHNEGKAFVIVVNKWDLVEKETNTMRDFTNEVHNQLPFMLYAPVLFISAKTGQRVEKLYEYIVNVSNNASFRIQTGVLNDLLNEAVAMVQPPSDKGKRLKVFYMTQVGIKPPTFVLFINDKELMHYSYERYIENQLRKAFGFEGTPIRFILREKNKET